VSTPVTPQHKAKVS